MADDTEKEVADMIADTAPARKIKPDSTKHVYLGEELLTFKDAGVVGPGARRIINSRGTFDHVSEQESGVWQYRKVN